MTEVTGLEYSFIWKERAEGNEKWGMYDFVIMLKSHRERSEELHIGKPVKNNFGGKKMIDRYTRPEMGAIWTDENRFNAWLEVEILACEAWAELGDIPKEDVANFVKMHLLILIVLKKLKKKHVMMSLLLLVRYPRTIR